MERLAVQESIFNIGHGVVLSPVGMTLPASVDEDQWNEIGDQVMRLDSASNWIIGDWWAYGTHNYGDRKKWVVEQKKKRSQMKSFQTLVNYSNVCKAFETNRRRLLVSFEMHKELANLPEAKQEKFLDLIEAGEIKTLGDLEKALGKVLKLRGAPLRERMNQILQGLYVEKQNASSLKRVKGEVKIASLTN